MTHHQKLNIGFRNGQSLRTVDKLDANYPETVGGPTGLHEPLHGLHEEIHRVDESADGTELLEGTNRRVDELHEEYDAGGRGFGWGTTPESARGPGIFGWGVLATKPRVLQRGRRREPEPHGNDGTVAEILPTCSTATTAAAINPQLPDTPDEKILLRLLD